MVIVVSQHVPHCFTTEDGDAIHDIIAPMINAGQPVDLVLTGIDEVTSSFVNAAIVPLVESSSPAFVKSNLRILDASKQASDMFRRCMSLAAERHAGS